MKVKRAYYYLFYKLYKFWEAVSVPKFWSDAKAIISIIALQAFTAMALLAYYKTFINKNSHIIEKKWIYILIGISCVFANYYFFLYEDRWKQIVHDFDKWPKRKNDRGSIIVGILIFTVIVNFVLATYFYLR